MKWQLAMMAIAAPLALVATNVYSANPHELGDSIDCTIVQGDVLSCDGTVVGLGNVQSVRLEGDAFCVNRGEKRPQGHQEGQEASVTSRNGRTSFNNVLLDADCPRPMTAEFENVELVFTTTSGEAIIELGNFPVEP
jgi:hypothetical protein